MFSRVRIAIRFFFVGLAVGVLLAPRSGEETRRLLREKADSLLNDVLEAASLGASATSSAATKVAEATAEAADAAADGDDGGGTSKRTRANSSRAKTATSTAASQAGV